MLFLANVCEHNGNALHPVDELMVGGVQAVFLLLLVFVAVFAGLARRLKVPYPILLVVAGLLLSFLPGMPRIELDPNLVFLVFLPPLLYSAAWTLSWREFQRNFVSIAMLAVGLVSFTVLGLAMTAGSLLPEFDWKSAVLLGAVVAATDAIAATRDIVTPHRETEAQAKNPWDDPAFGQLRRKYFQQGLKHPIGRCRLNCRGR
jgi:Sodium/hydrogen exchanger family